mgnify:CR=1 FL=1
MKLGIYLAYERVAYQLEPVSQGRPESHGNESWIRLNASCAWFEFPRYDLPIGRSELGGPVRCTDRGGASAGA